MIVTISDDFDLHKIASSVPIDTWISRVITDEYGGADPFPGYGDNAGIMQQYAFYYMQEHKNVV